MGTQLQRRGGTTTEHSGFTGAAREVTVDTDKQVSVVHDGTTEGGFAQMREDADNENRPDASTSQNWQIEIKDGVMMLKEV
mgnify:CR=1 FL=1